MVVPVWTNTRVKLGDLEPWSLNPRQSSKTQARRLLKSWERFGQVQTIAVGPSLEVYDGHQRLSALLTVHGAAYVVDARQASVPLSDQERRELVATLHAGAVGSWDWDVLSSWSAGDLMDWGFDAATLADWKRDVGALGNLIESEKVEADAEPQVDRADELREKWGVERGQLWRIGSHRLLCGDSTVAEDVERVMGGERARLCVTDPPYLVRYDPQWRVGVGGGGDQTFANGEVIENDDNTTWIEAFEHLPADVLYCWMASVTLKKLQSELEGYGFEMLYLIVWNKDLAVFGRGDYHHKHEPCLYMARKGAKHNWSGDRKQETVWDIPTIHSFANGHNSDEWGLVGHGNQKPLECMARPIRNNSADGEIVYDPFLGSGTTLVACENLGRRGRGIEISPGYVAVCLERMSVAFPGIEIERM